MDLLKKIPEIIASFTKGQVFKFAVIGLVVFILGSSAYLVYLNSDKGTKYPKVDPKVYHDIEENFLAIVDSAKDDPGSAINALEAYPPVPEQLENRRKFILAKLYESIGETVMAFVRANEIDEKYLTKHSCYLRVKLAERVGHEAAVMKNLEILRSKYPAEPK